MREPNALISTDALARELSASDLRVFDCTTYLEPPPPGSDDPYIAVPGAAASRRRTFRARTSSTCNANFPTTPRVFASGCRR
jgi:thiosulfate/3-mercaptopyruvate sulfurtransferase